MIMMIEVRRRGGDYGLAFTANKPGGGGAAGALSDQVTDACERAAIIKCSIHRRI